MTRSSSSSSTTPNGERGCATTIVAAASVLAWRPRSVGEVDVEQLVAVQREHVALLPAGGGGEAQAAAAPERLGLADRDDLRAEPGQLRLEELLLPAEQLTITRSTPARPSGSTWYAASGRPATGTSAFGRPCGSLAEALGLAAGEDDGFHR